MKVTIETSGQKYSVTLEMDDKTYVANHELTSYGAHQIGGVNFDEQDFDRELEYIMSDIESQAYELAYYDAETRERSESDEDGDDE
ncbi:hypothetical protein [Alicyclobacillus ferrooxydans]|uniref:Uncharacterized protein n=1 Tax=Alicyclobacillus ferrooxydans TaxID=471514 RepID=A0A0P9GNF5_9BACL|nr:hypothetical protein [Alicyclobacillus ferrooxydans]KPV42006.1 hypothetical protein AN477_19750 [Alicyclobacillus ferrooxydans]